MYQKLVIAAILLILVSPAIALFITAMKYRSENDWRAKVEGYKNGE